MSPRTKEQFEGIRKDRKAQIMKSAMELFSREGYGHVSIATLAKHAGISKGLMYNYFKSKDHLLKEIFDYGISEIMQHFDTNHDGILSTEEFELFIRKTFQIMRENQDFWVQFFGIIIQPNVSALIRESEISTFTREYFTLFEMYFKAKGFEDPLLEVFQLSVLIEGMGVMLFYSEGFAEIPSELFSRLEERIIKTYT